MVLVLFDTNILIDHTLGIKAATLELAGYDDAVISTISWMEATCKLSSSQITVFDNDLANAGIAIVQTNEAIMRRAGELRRLTSKKLPDCIILATAEVQGRLVITRDPVDFGGKSSTRVHVPYKLTNGIVSDVLPLP
ncbi:PIN domain-containing protein [Duganella aceris]|uniref:Type II toxin-antitoxin system VapC family toxin n=1 Tax=Duganella aceris TaxID=2703883 RepID=A0ABX0FFT5_9BURK|nr:PIN domain-containing protein [Duganella aceris]NGZ83370.1 type II toxin-antitoxin system VapC family toxin [Duganella aceris]